MQRHSGGRAGRGRQRHRGQQHDREYERLRALYPSGSALPTVSNLNYTAGQVVPNAFTVRLGGDGAFQIYASTSINFITDLTGYFAP